MSKNEELKIVLQVRYKGAWDEVNMRTSVRDRGILTYLVIAASLLGIAFSSEGLRNIAIVLPYIALVIALMQCHHDHVVGHLTRYLCDLAKEAGCEDDWFCKKKHLGSALRGGLWHTAAVVISVFGTSLIALIISRESAKRNDVLLILWSWGWLVLLLSICLLIGFRVWRFWQMKKLG